MEQQILVLIKVEDIFCPNCSMMSDDAHSPCGDRIFRCIGISQEMLVTESWGKQKCLFTTPFELKFTFGVHLKRCLPRLLGVGVCIRKPAFPKHLLHSFFGTKC